MIHCGCFTGSLNDFKNVVIKTHGDNYYGKWYLKHVEIMQLIADESESDYLKSIETKETEDLE